MVGVVGKTKSRGKPLQHSRREVMMMMDTKKSGLIRILYMEIALAGLTNGLDVGDEEKRVN